MGVETEMGVSLLSPGEDDVDLDADFVSSPQVEEGYDLDDALEATGNGAFQLLLAFIVLLAWAFNSMVTMATPFFISGMRKDMGLTPEQEGITAATLLFGFILGNTFWGIVADKVGRRPCILTCVLGIGVFNVAAAYGQLWWHVAALRVVVGFFIAGSMVPTNALVSELVPRSSRGRWLVFLHSFWQVGTLCMVFVSYYLRGREEWRELILATSVPALPIVLIMLLLGLPESPRYLLLMRRRQECLEVLERVAAWNCASLPEDQELMDIPPHNKVSPLADILQPTLFARTTLPLWAMFFWLNYASYGLTMWLKSYFGKIGMNDMVRELYTWMTVGKVLGVVLCAMVIESMPRRRVITICFIMAGVAVFAAVMAQGGEQMVLDAYVMEVSGNTLVLVLFSVAAFFEEACWGTLYTYSAEVYPSSIRSTGSGVAMAVGRGGGIIATLIGKTLMEEDPRLPFYMVSLAMFLGSVAVGVSRAETQGAKLHDI